MNLENPAFLPSPFSLGQIVVDRFASKKLCPEDIIPALSRHLLGEWGRVDKRRRDANNKVVNEKQKQSLCSVYFSTDGVKFRVVTNAERSLTTVKVF